MKEIVDLSCFKGVIRDFPFYLRAPEAALACFLLNYCKRNFIAKIPTFDN